MIAVSATGRPGSSCRTAGGPEWRWQFSGRLERQLVPGRDWTCWWKSLQTLCTILKDPSWNSTRPYWDDRHSPLFIACRVNDSIMPGRAHWQVAWIFLELVNTSGSAPQLVMQYLLTTQTPSSPSWYLCCCNTLYEAVPCHTVLPSFPCPAGCITFPQERFYLVPHSLLPFREMHKCTCWCWPQHSFRFYRVQRLYLFLDCGKCWK